MSKVIVISIYIILICRNIMDYILKDGNVLYKKTFVLNTISKATKKLSILILHHMDSV